MKYLVDQFEDLGRVVKRARVVCLLFDYDGTLSKIARTPSEAKISDTMRALLQEVVKIDKVFLAIISGRPIEEVKQMVGVAGAYYAGNHGFEIEGPNFRFLHPLLTKHRDELSLVVRRLRTSLSSFRGVLIENKGATISVHYRLVNQALVPKLKLSFFDVVHNVENIRITEGKMVLEVRPKIDWDKGKAANLILGKLKEPDLVFYVGDDQTDEDAFRALQSFHTILILNGKLTSSAKYYLRNQGEVETFLRWFGTNLA